MNNEWIPATRRPDYHCEVFVLAETTDKYYGYEKGTTILQSDSYNAKDDYFSNSDDDRLRIICWQEMQYPEVPELYKDKVRITFKVSSVINIPDREDEGLSTSSLIDNLEAEFRKGLIGSDDNESEDVGFFQGQAGEFRLFPGLSGGVCRSAGKAAGKPESH